MKIVSVGKRPEVCETWQYKCCKRFLINSALFPNCSFAAPIHCWALHRTAPHCSGAVAAPTMRTAVATMYSLLHILRRICALAAFKVCGVHWNSWSMQRDVNACEVVVLGEVCGLAFCIAVEEKPNLATSHRLCFCCCRLMFSISFIFCSFPSSPVLPNFIRWHALLPLRCVALARVAKMLQNKNNNKLLCD